MCISKVAVEKRAGCVLAWTHLRYSKVLGGRFEVVVESKCKFFVDFENEYDRKETCLCYSFFSFNFFFVAYVMCGVLDFELWCSDSRIAIITIESRFGRSVDNGSFGLCENIPTEIRHSTFCFFFDYNNLYKNRETNNVSLRSVIYFFR